MSGHGSVEIGDLAWRLDHRYVVIRSPKVVLDLIKLFRISPDICCFFYGCLSECIGSDLILRVI